MAQAATNDSEKASNSKKDEFVIVNKKVKAIKPTHLAETKEKVPVPPLIGNKNFFGQEYDIYDSFSICGGLNRPSNNLFINGLHLAFCHHLPFVLRPDDLWLQILQGLSIHVTLNKEKLQTSIVNFADPNNKISIKVRNDSLNAIDTSNDEKFENVNEKHYQNLLLESNNLNWKMVFEQFTQQCQSICAKKKKEKENEKKEKEETIIDWGLCDFSTSSQVCKVASQCSLFSVLSNYVSFQTMTCSGISKITLKGTIDDWKLLYKKCENLKSLDCDFWYEHLITAVSLIVQSVETLSQNKELDEKLTHFWNSIYHYANASGGAVVTGWCNAFIPYLFQGNKYGYDKNYTVKDGVDKETRCWGTHPWDFPSSYTKAPMTWDYFGKIINCTMVGGIVGIQQNEKDGAVAPIVGWMIHQS